MAVAFSRSQSRALAAREPCQLQRQLAAVGAMRSLPDSLRVATMVEARNDTNAIGEYHIEERVRKTREECSPDGLIDERTGEGMLGDEAHNELQGAKKLIAEPGQACLVPGMLLANVLIRKIGKMTGRLTAVV